MRPETHPPTSSRLASEFVPAGAIYLQQLLAPPPGLPSGRPVGYFFQGGDRRWRAHDLFCLLRGMLSADRMKLRLGTRNQRGAFSLRRRHCAPLACGKDERGAPLASLAGF